MSSVIDSLLENQMIAVFLILIIFGVVVVLVIMIIFAYNNGRDISVFGIEIKSGELNEKNDCEVEKNMFTICNIMSAHDLWSDFEGTFYAWNPSWQTELVTNPDDWADVHLRRYMDGSIKRVVYAVSKQPLVKNDYVKFFYYDGFKRFFQIFTQKNPTIIPRLEEKLEVYVVDQLPSNLSFFLGTSRKQKKEIALLLINDEPFCINGTPTIAFKTENEEVVNQMRNMFYGIMNEVESTKITSLVG